MDRMTDEPDVVIEEYEEVVENRDELSDRVESEDAETESIQEPTSINRRILTTHTGRPSLRSTNARLAGRQEESKPVVVTSHPVLVNILLKLFNLIMSVAHVPHGFRPSYTVPLPKEENYHKRNIVHNYRAISISPILSKIFEQCLLTRYNKFMQS